MLIKAKEGSGLGNTANVGKQRMVPKPSQKRMATINRALADRYVTELGANPHQKKVLEATK